jgi:hypothetical protein
VFIVTTGFLFIKSFERYFNRYRKGYASRFIKKETQSVVDFFFTSRVSAKLSLQHI